MSDKQFFINPKEAPDGFYAVLKEHVASDELGNICRACDWRSECQKPTTNFKVHNHRCMSYPIIASDGQTIEREDGCSVVFKRYQ